jgi:hypothetical protein
MNSRNPPPGYGSLINQYVGTAATQNSNAESFSGSQRNEWNVGKVHTGAQHQAKSYSSIVQPNAPGQALDSSINMNDGYVNFV